MADWRAHPAFAPYRDRLFRAPGADAPPLDLLQACARESSLTLPDGRALAIVEQTGSAGALAYERRVHDEAALGVRRGSWHDAMNVLAWIAFPRLKAALNATHRSHGEAPTPSRRDRARDAATLVDEFGLLFACDAPDVVQRLRAHAWRELFIDARETLAHHVAVRAVGHGLLDRLRAPHRSLTAKALIVPAMSSPVAWTDADFDAAAAALVANPLFAGDALTPLPVAALPGWDGEGLGHALLDDVSVFRPKVL